VIGSSETAQAWTDGSTYIAFSRRFVKRLFWLREGRGDLSSLGRAAVVLAHELCHDGDSTTMSHSPEFDKAFRELVEQGAIALAVSHVYKGLTPKVVAQLEKSAAKRKAEPEGQVDFAPDEGEAIAAKETKKEAPPAKKASKAPAGLGRTAKEVTAAAEIARIRKAYKGNGGSLSYEGIELDRSFNLRQANGMTAYRICNRKK
jgi:hypothetical protein